MVIFKVRGCMTFIRTKGDKDVAFGGQLTQIHSKTVKNYAKYDHFLGERLHDSDEDKGENGVTFLGQLTKECSKMVKN